MNRTDWTILGLTVAAAVFVTGALVTTEYGTAGIPLYIGSLAVGPLLYALIADSVHPTTAIREKAAP